jgi:hypothetical protein
MTTTYALNKSSDWQPHLSTRLAGTVRVSVYSGSRWRCWCMDASSSAYQIMSDFLLDEDLAQRANLIGGMAYHARIRH